MKLYSKYLYSLLFTAIASISLSSCSEDTMDKINSNSNHLVDADARLLITNITVTTPFSSVGGTLALYSSIYMEQEAGVFNQTFNAEQRIGEPTSTATYNNEWQATYSNLGQAKTIIKRCYKGGLEEGNNVGLGIGRILLAYNGAILTDLFGDVPYFQAGEFTVQGLPVYYQPKIDRQADIYKDIMSQLDTAIVNLSTRDAAPRGSVGQNDFIYGGKASGWLKAAYALKARYTMRLLARSSDKTKDLNDILSFLNKSFTSANEEAKLSIYDGSTQLNPLAAFSYSREALGASRSLVNKFKERNDPRGLVLFANVKNGTLRTDFDAIVSAPNGKVKEGQSTYDFTVTNFSRSAPTQLISYQEVAFLKAEAYARLGKKAEAEEALIVALGAAFTNLEVSINRSWREFDDRINYSANLPVSLSLEYYNKNVKSLFEANPLKEIMIQKYLAFVGASGEQLEAYNDYRRMMGLKENFVILENPLNSTKFPLRFVYGNSDTSNNSNFAGLVGDGTYVYSEPVWWAGGTR